MKTCTHINKTIVFMPDCIIPCCTLSSFYAPKYAERESLDIDFSKRKKEIQELINSPEIENLGCNKCCFLEETEENSNQEKYNLIILKHWTDCNCFCIYCDWKSFIQNRMPPKYSAYEVIKKLYEQNMIDKENLVVQFQGGDIGVLKEFNRLVELFEENGFKRMDFLTNNIIYQNAIERLLAQGKASLSVSLDCGSAQTFKKIKKIDKFDIFIRNLKKYIEKSSVKEAINVSYIIVDKYNDNKSEIKKYIDLMYKLGVKTLSLRLDHKYIKQYDNIPIPYNNWSKKMNELYSFFYKYSEKYNMKLDMNHNKEQTILLEKISQAQKEAPLLSKIKTIFGVNK